MDLKRVKTGSLSDKVKKAIYEYIKSMDVEKNDKLPRENLLSKKLGVSRITIRKALNELAQEGIIFRIHGKGTFVNPEAVKINVNFNPAKEFKEMIKNSGYNASVELVEFEIKKAGYKISNKLRIGEQDQVAIFEKVYYADGSPAIISVDRFPRDIIKGEIYYKKLEHKSIFNYLLEEAGQIIEHDLVEINVTTNFSNKNLVNYFDSTEPKALLVFESLKFNKDNNPILYSTEYFDTNFVKFNVIRKNSYYE